MRGTAGNRSTTDANSDFGLRDKAEALANIDVKKVMHDVQERSRQYMDESERYIRANPFRVVLAAAGIGMVVGFFLRRARS